MTTKKAPAQKKITKQSVYFIAFMHGKPGELQVENQEIHYTDLDKIENQMAIKIVENELAKNFINPKIINFVYLRKQK
jgi:hypothetical protein